MKILVIGATGMLGHKMLQILGHEFPNQVYGSTSGPKAKIEKFNLVPAMNLLEFVNIENMQQTLEQLDQLKPQVVVNCSGITLRKIDQAQIEKNFHINSYFPRVLSLWCQNNQSRLIHFSTDCVFDGQKGNYTEKDFPTAHDIYGRSKYLGEVEALRTLTLRVSIVGRELFGKTELLEWFLAQKNKTIQGYSEVYYSGLTTNFLAREVVRILKEFPDLSGLYQISSERISKYDLLVLADQIFKNQTEITKESGKHSDKSLNCDKYASVTKFKKPQWAPMLQALAQDPFLYERV